METLRPGYLLTIGTDANKLEKMFFNLKPCPFRQLSLNISKVAIGELDDLVTLRAYQVVMVLQGSPDKVTAVATRGMNLTDKPQIRENIKGAVDRG